MTPCCYACHPTVKRRFVFQCKGESIYEWEQSLDEVRIYVKTPPGVVGRASNFNCKISARKLQLGLKGATDPPFFIDEATSGLVNVDESTWTIEDGDDCVHDGQRVLVIYLAKANLGAVWESALQGPDSENAACLDPGQLEEVKQELMRERWQKENPGMDFSGATFNGSSPDPRTFMGGAKYD